MPQAKNNQPASLPGWALNDQTLYQPALGDLGIAASQSSHTRHELTLLIRCSRCGNRAAEVVAVTRPRQRLSAEEIRGDENAPKNGAPTETRYSDPENRRGYDNHNGASQSHPHPTSERA